MSKKPDVNILNKGIFTGPVEKDENGNFFCGKFLLDYKMVTQNFELGDLITLKNVVTNPSDISFKQYPQKSKNFAKANLKPEN
jgi:hypothetical protein